MVEEGTAQALLTSRTNRNGLMYKNALRIAPCPKDARVPTCNRQKPCRASALPGSPVSGSRGTASCPKPHPDLAPLISSSGAGHKSPRVHPQRLRHIHIHFILSNPIVIRPIQLLARGPPIIAANDKDRIIDPHFVDVLRCGTCSKVN